MTFAAAVRNESNVTALSPLSDLFPSSTAGCRSHFLLLMSAFLVLWALALLTEAVIACVSMRGTIFDDEPRRAAQYLLYVKLGEETLLRVLLPFMAIDKKKKKKKQEVGGGITLMAVAQQ